MSYIQTKRRRGELEIKCDILVSLLAEPRIKMELTFMVNMSNTALMPLLIELENKGLILEKRAPHFERRARDFGLYNLESYDTPLKYVRRTFSLTEKGRELALMYKTLAPQVLDDSQTLKEIAGKCQSDTPRFSSSRWS